MNRNEEQRFATIPRTGIERSTITDYKQECLSTIKMGELIPFFSDETIMPADTFQLNIDLVLRCLTAKTPTMGNLFIDIFMFFVPLRTIWEHTEAFYGENPDGAWTQEVEYYTPIITTKNGFTSGSIVDYLYGAPIGIPNLWVSAFSLRSYIKCYNDWFRDQNWIAPKELDKSDADTEFDENEPTKGGKPFKIAKYHDIITSLLPAPQKGTAVSVPLGTTAPVSIKSNGLFKLSTNGTDDIPGTPGIVGGHIRTLGTQLGTSTATPLGVFNTAQKVSYDTDLKYFDGLSAETDLSGATSASINALREAFAYQRIMEKMARGGSRYTEIIKSFWGVSASSARLQRAEYLGGKSIPIDMTEIPQTSGTTDTSPQGHIAAFSRTVNSDRLFTKSFEEHGVIIGMYAIRQRHLYSQGIEKQYKIRRKFERYFPQLAHLGEQPVYTEEIYATGNENQDKTVLGFQEAWWFYRYRLNKITGYMRPDIPNNLAIWHYGDYYKNAPVLGEQFINETDEYLRRTLAVTDNETHQFEIATVVYGKVTRALPLYGIPGLIDHF